MEQFGAHPTDCHPGGHYIAVQEYNQTDMLVPTMATTFDVVAEPMRRRILDLLRERPRPVGELVGLLGISQPGVSKHLRVLRDARLVRVRPDAQQRWYEVDPEPLSEIDAWLEPYRTFWADRLDALERHLDGEDRP